MYIKTLRFLIESMLEVFRAGLRYLDPPHDLTIDRYLEDGRMVEHVRYPGRGMEMRRIFRREAAFA